MFIWVDVVNCLWRNVVINYNGVSVVECLGDVVFNLCVSWLDVFKVFGLCVVVVKGWILRLLEGEFVEGEFNGELLKCIFLVDWMSSLFLIVVWLEFKGWGGLGLFCWCVCVLVVEFLLFFVEYDLIGEKVNDYWLLLLEELFWILIFRMGFVDLYW